MTAPNSSSERDSLDVVVKALEAERFGPPVREWKPPRPSRAYTELLELAQLAEASEPGDRSWTMTTASPPASRPWWRP